MCNQSIKFELGIINAYMIDKIHSNRFYIQNVLKFVGGIPLWLGFGHM